MWGSEMIVTFDLTIKVKYEINSETFILQEPEFDQLKQAEHDFAQMLKRDVAQNMGPHCTVIKSSAEAVVCRIMGTPVEEG